MRKPIRCRWFGCRPVTVSETMERGPVLGIPSTVIVDRCARCGTETKWRTASIDFGGFRVSSTCRLKEPDRE